MGLFNGESPKPAIWIMNNKINRGMEQGLKFWQNSNVCGEYPVVI